MSRQKLQIRVAIDSLSLSLSTYIYIYIYIYISWFLGKTENPREIADGDDSDLPFFDFRTVASGTKKISDDNKIGEGGFGTVYKGTLKDGRDIAVKRLSWASAQGVREFMNEVKLMVNLQHKNLVRMLGCCVRDNEKMLIYEYMPNKSLKTFIR
ncbi:unnamed protein product [Spirodela intermedia]|uniref:non-specific serine/threonine protein kinase n=1 Tax=Spirodela intermedia TaxID=51605 RepID=A0A7I8LG70_SPIIN|nr:unnamed protein product [Spirodela intermedia]